MNDQIDAFTRRLSVRVYRYLERRVERAYPAVQPVPEKKEKTETGVFAEGCSFYKIVLLFIIGAFLGDITEAIFCRITAGVWMSRSSLVWGPFSIVWGLAIALATWFLYNYRDRSDGFLFAFGTFLGGAYEYICSVFTEIVFGKVFWDYSDIPFNLGGRINLLYCFFWGIAAVVWLKNSILSFRAGLKNPDEIRRNHHLDPDRVHGGQHARIYPCSRPIRRTRPPKARS